ncbi:hypothetical protein QEH44_gp66 [Arthrobacter phage Shambre1]|uniref:Uncharacterized protein n=1 Tax=Arthrobacter phage Shambre1 TaxID=2927284 RepID=A0A977KNP6_9CAUD|nr:hypothetical protein QEH44_gp66 [Arthrobacter phage Shambre1]UXE04803.1 hypothetical protein SEA_SHAMBRE1_66 [Arthrobacter phage Shambre1]
MNKPMNTAVGPDCRDGKHPCAGTALDPVTDDIVECACPCHSKQAPTYSPTTEPDISK